MGKTFELFIGGLVTIGIITALVLPDRKTADVLKAAGSAGGGLFQKAMGK